MNADLSFSLLRPSQSERISVLDETACKDLRYTRIIDQLVINKKRPAEIHKYAKELCLDVEMIEYRQEVLDDLLRNRDLVACIADLVPHITRLQFYVMHPGKTESTPLQETVWRLRELEHYVYCVTQFSKAFDRRELPLRSAGLSAFRDIILDIAAEEGFAQIREELPALLKKINSIKSITIGINLTDGLMPVEATLLSINQTPFREAGFLGKVVTTRHDVPLGPLYSDPEGLYTDTAMSPFFRDISRVMIRAVKPLRTALARFGHINGQLFAKLLHEFMFYLGAIRLIDEMEGLGMPMVRPRISPASQKVFDVRGMYNMDLILEKGDKAQAVLNDLEADANTRIFILTGPNSGGKTTFLQAAGIVQILAQTGLHVPARSAHISICDNVYTHYPDLEDTRMTTGRFGEEASRLRLIFEKGSGDSLYLLNETFSSTSFGEAMFLARDLLRVFNRLGGRVIFVTHLHQLAENADSPGDGVSGESGITSLVAGIRQSPDGGIVPTYTIMPGPPLGKSYADELARRYGISEDQLLGLVNRKDKGEESEKSGN